MKKDIQPEVKKAKITCACGNVIETLSTKETLKVDICSKCHPFWTGSGTPDKFREKYGM